MNWAKMAMDTDPYRDTGKTCCGRGMHCPSASSYLFVNLSLFCCICCSRYCIIFEFFVFFYIDEQLWNEYMQCVCDFLVSEIISANDAGWFVSRV